MGALRSTGGTQALEMQVWTCKAVPKLKEEEPGRCELMGPVPGHMTIDIYNAAEVQACGWVYSSET